jgi:hypothetical protein
MAPKHQGYTDGYRDGQTHAQENERTSRTRSRGPVAFAVALTFGVTLLVGGLAAPAAALDDISPTAMGSEGSACPTLTSVKYPWLGCTANEFGGVTLSLPGQPAPLECRMRLPSGECAASPNEWRFEMPIIGPGPKS